MTRTITARQVLLLLLLLALPGPAAAEPHPGEETFGLGQELTVGLGTLPTNTSGMGLSIYGSYALQPWRYLGWEVVGGFYFLQVGEAYKQELAQRFDVQATEPTRLRSVIHSSLFIQPLSGRLLLPGDLPVTGDLRLQLGYAMASFSSQVASGLNVGLRLRVRIDPISSIGFDLRQYLFFPGGALEHSLYVGFAFIVDLTQGR